MDVGDFGGMARYMAAGGDASVTAIELAPFGHPPISIMPFSTGFTFGGGAGVGTGVFSRVFPPMDASRAPGFHH
jgi:hypothetical protein